MHFIGGMLNPKSYSIAANLQWINVIFEILNEAFLLPLFFIFHKIIKHKKKIIGKTYFIILIYLFFIVLFISIANPLLKQMAPSSYGVKTLDYVRLEMATKLFLLIINITTVLLIAQNKKSYLLFIFITQSILNIMCDLFLFSQFSFSCQLGVMGIAYSDFITSILIFCCCLFFVQRLFHFSWNDLGNPSWDLKFYANWQIIASGTESLVRNVFYVVFVLSVINHMQNPQLQGVWWALSSFFYTWLLIPIFVLSKYINNQMKLYQNNNFWEKFSAIFLLMICAFLLWIILIPFYPIYTRDILKITNYNVLTHLIDISLGFYCFFAICEIIDKTFYGEGKAHYVLLQSIITNIVVYLPFYFARQNYSITMIAIMFGLSMTVDTCLTMTIFWWRHWGKNLRKNKKLRSFKESKTMMQTI